MLARPVTVVAPWIPKREPTDKFPVEIRVSGSISESGVLESPVFSPEAGLEKYIRAIQEVLPYWQFQPATDKESCGPVRSRGAMTVWFEEKDGVPSVWVSSPAKETAAIAKNEAKPPRKPRVYVSAPRPRFPTNAARAGMEGEAVLLFKVDFRGDVVDTRLLYAAPHKAFGQAALDGARGVKFSPGTEEEDAQKSICILVPMNFCLLGTPHYPYSSCSKNRSSLKE